MPPPRFPGLDHRRARLEPWARIEGCAGRPLCLERPPGGDLGVGSGHLARWHSSSARVRLVDGGLWWPEGGATAVELERDIKRLDRYQAAVADVDAAWSAGVWWFTPVAQVDLVRSRLQTAGAGAHHQGVTAPEGVAP